jgi:hypothetical protein
MRKPKAARVGAAVRDKGTEERLWHARVRLLALQGSSDGLAFSCALDEYEEAARARERAEIAAALGGLRVARQPIACVSGGKRWIVEPLSTEERDVLCAVSAGERIV